jgi:hypothetical protein
VKTSILITPTLTLPPQGGGKYKEAPQKRLWGIEKLIKAKSLKLTISRYD